MLKARLPGSRQARNVRLAQVILGVAGAFLLLSWAEARPAPVEVGHETLSLGVSAPAVHPRGPWPAGWVFTDAGPGVPVDVAPMATVRAAYSHSGIDAREGAWSASLRIAERDDGGSWWQVDRPLPVTPMGDQATLQLDLAAILDEAKNLTDTARVPGTLGITVNVTHAAAITFQGAEVVAVRTATLDLVPSDGLFLLAVAPDEGVYREYPGAPFPIVGVAVLAVAAALELLLAAARRSWQPWERFPGTSFVLVEAHLPPDVAWTDLASLMRMARRARAPAMVDPGVGVALLPGVLTVAAPLAVGPEGVIRPMPHRPHSPFHHTAAELQAAREAEVEEATVTVQVPGTQGETTAPPASSDPAEEPPVPGEAPPQADPEPPEEPPATA